MNVVPPSIEPVYTLVPRSTVSLLGLALKDRKFGIQKIPYPDRMTVLGSTLYASPIRGAKLLLSNGMLFRLAFLPVFTRNTSPLSTRPEAWEARLSALGSK